MTDLSDSILRLYSEGKSYNEIKAALGCSKGTIAYHLGAGQKEKHLKRQRDQRSNIRRYLQEVRQEAVCADCKEDYPYCILEFDHVRGVKLFNVCDGRNKPTMEMLLTEIAKCDIVCSNCHKNRTHYRKIKSGSDTIDLSNKYSG